MINMIRDGGWLGVDIKVFRENIIFINTKFLFPIFFYIKSYFAFKNCFIILRRECKRCFIFPKIYLFLGT